MTVASVYKQGWTMDDVHWSLFDPSRVEPNLLAAVKAAALVEYNAPDYVAYLKRVFASAGPATLASLEQWGQEEAQHGRALGRGHAGPLPGPIAPRTPGSPVPRWQRPVSGKPRNRERYIRPAPPP